MSTPPTDRLVANARIAPDDTPHEAATHVWAQIVANHDVDPGDPLTPLGVFDRVVLVLRDVVGLSDATVAQVLNTNEEAIRRAHGAARTRLGLPAPGDDDCAGWPDVRAAHLPGDPALLAALVAHTQDCPDCSGAVLADQHRLRPRGARGVVGAAAAGSGTTPSAAVLLGAVGVAAAVVTAAVAIGASIAPLPEPGLPQPAVVDADPALPSDEEPVEGWPRPPTDSDRGATSTTDAGDGAGGATEASNELVEDLTGRLDDATGPVTDPLDDAVGEVTDTIDDTLDEAGDTLGETLDETTDTLHETTDTLDETTNTVDETTDAVEDATDLP